MANNYSNIKFIPKPITGGFKDLEGLTFERWTVLGLISSTPTRWFCECKCGNTAIVLSGNLIRNGSLSCGCLREEKRKKPFVSDNGHKTPECMAFRGAKGRCKNPKNKFYNNYGGRGIKFCFDSVAELVQEIGKRPSPMHSLDRIDNNGHYEKGNVRWATKIEQMQNTRRNTFIVINGVAKCLAEWCRIYKWEHSTPRGRIARGWCSPCAIVLPIGQSCSHKTIP